MLLAALGLAAAGMSGTAPQRRPPAEVAAARDQAAATAEAVRQAPRAEPRPVPEHIRRALDGEDAPLPRGLIVLRVASALLLMALLAAGVASAAGLIPSPLALIR
jgi:hypothetical protein